MYVKEKTFAFALSRWKGIFGSLSLEGADFSESTGGFSFMSLRYYHEDNNKSRS